MASTIPLDHTAIPLPLSTPAENLALAQPSTQPAHCDEREWALHLPPPITPYSEYECSSISFYTRDQLDGELVEGIYTGRKRWEVVQVLKIHRHLRSLLEANLAVLEKYGEEQLAVAASSTELRSFAQNHCALHETLDGVEKVRCGYGLPGREAYRAGRNYFSHTFLTPKKSIEGVEREVKGTKDLYSVFLEQVIATEGVLQEGLNDQGRWAEVKENWNAAIASRPTSPQPEEDQPSQEEDQPSQGEDQSSRLPARVPQGFCLRWFKAMYYRSSFVRWMADTIGKALLTVRLEYRETDWNDV
jgi:hypothetical protein